METTLGVLFDDLWWSQDEGTAFLFVLLDVFNNFNHDILLHWLQVVLQGAPFFSVSSFFVAGSRC